MARPEDIVITDDYYAFLADAGTALPAFGDDDRADPTGFTKVADGLRINDDGVTIMFSREIEEVMTSRSRQPIKAINSTESVMVMFETCQFDMETLAANLLGEAGEAVDTTVAGSGTAGYRELELDHGLDVKQYALIIQFGFSVYDTGLKGDFYMPFCYQSADPELVISKTDATKMKFEFKQLSSDDSILKPSFRFMDAVSA